MTIVEVCKGYDMARLAVAGKPSTTGSRHVARVSVLFVPLEIEKNFGNRGATASPLTAEMY